MYIGPGSSSPTGTYGDAIVDYNTVYGVTLTPNGGSFINVNDGGFFYSLNDRTAATTAIGGSWGDSIASGSGNDTIDGAGGNDTIDAGDGADLVDGGVGTDFLTGGGGADEFYFAGPGSGGDLIMDFVVGTDKIRLSTSYGISLGEVLALLSDDGSGSGSGFDSAFFNLGGGDSFTLSGVDFRTLTIDDFLIDNVAPTAVITAASYSATEQTDLSLKGQLSVDDTDDEGEDVTVTLSVTSGILTVTAGTSGAVVTNSGTATVTLKGSISEINTLLGNTGTSTVIFNANSDTPASTATLKLEINDDGNTGTDGAKKGSDTATINITGVNDKPTVTAPATPVSATEDTPLNITGITVGDPDSGSGDVTVTLSVLPAKGTLSANVSLVPRVDVVTKTGSIDLIGKIDDINAYILAAKVLFTPAADVNGTVTIGITIYDNGNSGGATESATTSMTLNIAAVNDAPTLDITRLLTSLAETTDTSSPRKVATFVVHDDEQGSNTISLVNDDKDMFYIDGNGVYLKAGAVLDFETNPKLDLGIQVDDTTLGSTPEVTGYWTIYIDDVPELITGTNKANKLTGTDATEIIDGKGGNDTIKGGGGADTIIGGAGKDVMTGGAGPDVFQFKPGDMPKPAASDYVVANNNHFDRITDFTQGEDKIDLSAIDANTRKSGNQAFEFGGRSPFVHGPAEITYKFSGDKTIIVGDVNGDRYFDFRIVLDGKHHLTADDFIL